MRRASPGSHLPPPPSAVPVAFVVGAEFHGHVSIHPPPPAPPPAPPVALAEMERLCATAVRDLVSERACVTYQAVATRVCATRGVHHLSQLGVTDPTGQVTVLGRVWRAQQLIDAHVVSYVGMRVVSCLKDLEKDLCSLLDVNHLRPRGGENDEGANPEEISIENDDENDDDKNADNKDPSFGCFESFNLGPVTANPAVRYYFQLDAPMRAATPRAMNAHTIDTSRFMDGAAVAKHLGFFLADPGEKSGRAFAAYLLTKENSGASSSLQQLGVTIQNGPVAWGSQAVAAGHVLNKLVLDATHAEHAVRVSSLRVENTRRELLSLSKRKVAPPRLSTPKDAHTRAFIQACGDLIPGPYRPSKGKMHQILKRKCTYSLSQIPPRLFTRTRLTFFFSKKKTDPNENPELLAAAAEYAALRLCGGKVRSGMFAREDEAEDADDAGAEGADTRTEEDGDDKQTDEDGADVTDGARDNCYDDQRAEADIPETKLAASARGVTRADTSSSDDDDDGDEAEDETDEHDSGVSSSSGKRPRNKRKRDDSESPGLVVLRGGVVQGTHVRSEAHAGCQPQSEPFEACSKHGNDDADANANANKNNKSVVAGDVLKQCVPWWEPCDVSDPRAVGRWGEALVYNFLCATRPGWSVEWLNEHTESTSFYDVKMVSPLENSKHGNRGRRVVFVEVKTTRSRDKNVFEMSPNEWSFASRPGVDYRVFRVFSAGDKQNVRIVVVKDPAKMVQERGIALCLAI